MQLSNGGDCGFALPHLPYDDRVVEDSAAIEAAA
jgi:hypothetical protein